MKIGIVGGYGHESLRGYPEAELAWAADGYDEQAFVRAKARNCANTYESFEALLAKFQPDVVYIGSAYGRNGGLSIQALEKGYPVVSEKPLANNFQELDKLRELTADGRLQVIGEFAMRWNGAFAKARELIQAGRIGAPVHVQAQKSYKFGATRPSFYKTRALFGGIIPWVAIHAIDYAAWCTGLSYEAVTATHANRCHPEYPEMEDSATIQFLMKGGVPCQIVADFLRPKGAATHGDDRLRVTGQSGVVEVRISDVFLTDAEGEKTWSIPTGDEIATQLALDLVNAATGKAQGIISTRETLEVTEAALVAREAADLAQSGTPVWQTLGAH